MGTAPIWFHAIFFPLHKIALKIANLNSHYRIHWSNKKIADFSLEKIAIVTPHSYWWFFQARSERFSMDTGISTVLSVADPGFSIGVGAPTSDKYTFRWKHMQKWKNWILLGACTGRAASIRQWLFILAIFQWFSEARKYRSLSNGCCTHSSE